MFCSQRTKTGRWVLGISALGMMMCGAQEVAPVVNSGDTGWILTATALVLFMTMPGLALFYGGLVRGQNVLSVMAQCAGIACMASLLWVAGLYSLAFKGDGGWIGNLDAAFLKGITRESVAPGTTVPESLFVMFQMTFAIITPGLYVGAVVERMKFGAIMLFTALWLALVYTPVAHWVWGGGWLQDMGIRDLAGGIVVHATAGVSAWSWPFCSAGAVGFPNTRTHRTAQAWFSSARPCCGWDGLVSTPGASWALAAALA